MTFEEIQAHDVQTHLQEYGITMTYLDGTADGRDILGIFDEPSRGVDLLARRAVTFSPKFSFARQDAGGLSVGAQFLHPDGRKFEVKEPPAPDGAGMVQVSFKEVPA